MFFLPSIGIHLCKLSQTGVYKATFPGVGGNGIKLLGKKFKSGGRESEGKGMEEVGKGKARQVKEKRIGREKGRIMG